MRTALLRPAALSLIVCACAQATTTTGATHLDRADSGNGSAATRGEWTLSPAAAAAEDAHYLARANRLRQHILDASEWTDFGEGACNPGDLRAFTKDTSREAAQRIGDDIDELERTIVGRGISNPIDTPSGHQLLDTVVGWEAAVTRPHWDVPPGEPLRQAIATGLSGEFKNPQTGKCESYVVYDTVTVVVPDLPGYVTPKLPKVHLKLFKGEQGLDAARDAYYAANAKDPNSIFEYTRVRAMVIWDDYAVVAVNRPVESRGIVKLPRGAGGASYIFHRVDGEWRLLVIARTWA